MMVDLVQTTTRDGVRLDGIFQTPPTPGAAGLPVDGFCLVHGAGGNFYSSTLFDAVAEHLVGLGCAVLRVNTRGHDLISNAVTAQGGRRLGAAYEVVDDCRHDLAAWSAWLAQRAGSRIGLVGHSLGAVKCIYAMAHEPSPLSPLPEGEGKGVRGVYCVVAVSPPRLAYSHFCTSPESAQFLEDYTRAEQLVQAGQPSALVDVKLPMAFAITAGGYVEKYGPEERYDYIRLLRGFPCPVLVTLGSREVESNMAFRGTPEALAVLRDRHGRPDVQVIPGADHFYTGVRQELTACVEAWLRSAHSNPDYSPQRHREHREIQPS